MEPVLLARYHRNLYETAPANTVKAVPASIFSSRRTLVADIPSRDRTRLMRRPKYIVCQSRATYRISRPAGCASSPCQKRAVIETICCNDSADHLKRYIQLLFSKSEEREPLLNANHPNTLAQNT